MPPETADSGATATPPSLAPTTLEEFKAALDAVREQLNAAPERASAYRDLYVYCIDLLSLVDARIRKLGSDAEIDPEQLESLCVLLGPYRNLTTLTCSLLSLHPECLVLNHAGQRALPNRRLNFLADYSRDKFLEFVRYAGYASRSGVGGEYGGDIRLSHAFGFGAMQQAEAKLHGRERGPTRCLVWKESHRVSNFLRRAHVDVPGLLQANGKLRFLLPVRDPIDCAVSNLERGHVKFFRRFPRLTPSSPVEEVVDAVLNEIAWFVDLREKSGRPERFFLYFEHEIGKEVLERMLRFLGLSHDEPYLTAAVHAFRAEGARRKEPRIVERYADQVTQKFGRYPEIQDALLRFAHR
jgi:hypothetical protein